MQKKSILTLTVFAAAAIAACRPINADGTATADNGFPLGFTDDSAAAGESVAVDVIGTTIAIAGAAVAKGDALKLSDGAVVPEATASNAIALSLSDGVAGEKIEILLLPRAA